MQSTDDAQHLQLLSIFHYVVGGISGLLACFPIFHLMAGIFIIVASFNREFTSPSGGPPPLLFGVFFVVIAGSFILAGWAFAIGLFVAGWSLAQRRRYMFCLVMAGIACLFTPFGTVLGIFTILVLVRPSVKVLFGVAGVPA